MKIKTRISKCCALLLSLVMIAGYFVTVTPAEAGSSLVIGQAASDERGGIRGGRAGDQNGKEVATTNWSYSSNKSSYNHWEYVIRAKDPKTANKLAAFMKQAINNNHIGYDQKTPDRYSLYDEAKKVKWNIAAIKKDCETTCASVIGVCVYAAGIPTPRYYDSSVIIDDLKDSGKFYFFTDSAHTSKKDKLEPGDILVSPGSHTIMVIDSPNYAGKEAKTKGVKVSTTVQASTGGSSSPFKAGKDYQLMANMNVRGGATTTARIVTYSQLSSSAKQYSLGTGNAVFAKGTIVTCIKAKGNWIKAPSGWICGREGSTTYLVEYKGTPAQAKLVKEALSNAKNSREAAAKKTTTAKTTATSKKTTTTNTPATVKKTSSNAVAVKKGRDYKLATALYVRTGPGTNYAIKKRNQLTKDAKKHAFSGTNALLRTGTVVTCLEVRGEWMRIPSGWICCKKGYIKY